MSTLNIDGIQYEIIQEKKGLTTRFPERAIVYLKRPKGKKAYVAIRYENGSFSTVMPTISLATDPILA